MNASKYVPAVALSIAAALLPATTAAVDLLPSGSQPGLARLLAAYDAPALTRGIATFDAVPSAAQVAALRSSGLVTQPMRRVPLALVYGTVAAMQGAVAAGLARDIYPDESIELFDT
ncbi:MAG: hypothetical protein M3O07_01250, partial [Pseudomonadota bacterium]|nr:hypothetical protein [Pseudomonadota bacterium]